MSERERERESMDTMSPQQHLHPPEAAQHQQQELQEHVKRVTSSLNVLSFGFLATAVLISVFLVVALLERFLHRSPPAHNPPSSAPLNPQASGEPSSTPQFSLLISEKRCLMGVSVLMPGQDIPTFIAKPAPMNLCHAAYVNDGDPQGHDGSRQDVGNSTCSS